MTSTEAGAKVEIYSDVNLANKGDTYNFVVNALDSSGVETDTIIAVLLECDEITLMRERRLQSESYTNTYKGNRITPLYVSFTDDERVIGEAAKNQATINPT